MNLTAEIKKACECVADLAEASSLKGVNDEAIMLITRVAEQLDGLIEDVELLPKRVKPLEQRLVRLQSRYFQSAGRIVSWYDSSSPSRGTRADARRQESTRSAAVPCAQTQSPRVSRAMDSPVRFSQRCSRRRTALVTRSSSTELSATRNAPVNISCPVRGFTAAGAGMTSCPEATVARSLVAKDDDLVFKVKRNPAGR